MSDPLELRREMDRLCAMDFCTFAYRAFTELESKELTPSVHIAIIAELMRKIFYGEVRRGLVCIPPRYLKTFLITICLSAWILGRRPGARIICASYGASLAEKFSSDTLRLMRSPWYRRIFPGTVISPYKQSAVEFATTAGGYRLATSVGGTLTGRGADFVFIDDPLKASDAHSPVARQGSIDWYNGSVLSRFDDPKKGAIVTIAQRLHAEDLPGHLIETGSYEQLILPAINPQDAFYDVLPGGKKVFFEAGRILMPQRHDLGDLEQKKLEMGEHDFEAQFNQRPLPPGGATFKAAWIKRYDKLPHEYQIQEIMQSWDTAYEGGEHNDFSVCTTWALCSHGYYLLDVWRGKPEFWQLEKKVYELREKWNASLVIMERAGAGISLIQNIKNRDGRQWIVHYGPQPSKIDRAQQQTPKFEQGKIFMPSEAEWLPALEKELFSFPHGKHDDQVDSVVQFLMAVDSGNLLGRAKAFGRKT